MPRVSSPVSAETPFQAPATRLPDDDAAYQAPPTSPLSPDRAFLLKKIVNDSRQEPIRYVRMWLVRSEGE